MKKSRNNSSFIPQLIQTFMHIRHHHAFLPFGWLIHVQNFVSRHQISTPNPSVSIISTFFFAFIIFDKVAYLGSFKRKSHVITAGKELV
mmetsp:Transcript_16790/g.24949  ORF Transcript_16790/g.24949 Transcript_16790/m.24949 type:complete len:89 (+) Transcript_16790:109-375(+)